LLPGAKYFKFSMEVVPAIIKVKSHAQYMVVMIT